MTRYDPELIAALAEGRLDPTEAEALERAIADDPRASADLAAQRIALEAMREEPVPMLTEAERSDMRRRVAAELGLAREATPAPAPRRIAWGSIAVAGAALVGVIAIVPVVGLLTTSGDADDAAAVSLADASQAPARSDDLVFEAAPPPVTSEAVERSTATTSATDGAADTTAASEGPTTTTGSGTTAAPGTTTVPQSERDAWLAEWRDETADPATAGAPNSTTPCLEQADIHLDDATDEGVLVEGAEYSDTAAVAFYLVDEAGDVGEIAAFIAETCELIAALE
jgi:anti-sigma factor RsiW